MTRPPVALTIAGSDSGGGAGIQADLKTFSALGAYGCSVIAALTAQNTRTVDAVFEVPPDFVAAQMDSVFCDIEVDAVKIGMLGNRQVIEAVAAGLDRHEARNVVLDPVMVAKSGDRLLRDDAVAALRELLVPRADLITPNLPEAAALLGVSDSELTCDGMGEAAARLRAFGTQAVLLKGGHLEGPDACDILVDGEGSVRLEAERIDTPNTHGTGCTLSSAIAANLARGHPLREAVAGAKDYITEAIRAGAGLAIGGGHGPVHHFHDLWNRKERRS